MRRWLLVGLLAAPQARADLNKALGVAATEDRDFRVYGCERASVGEPCNLYIEQAGFSGRLFVVFKRETNGDLRTIRAGNLGPGLLTLSLQFQEARPANILVIVLDRGMPVAMDGVVFNVYPPRGQLGEQVPYSLGLELKPDVDPGPLFVPETPIYGPLFPDPEPDPEPEQSEEPY